MCNDPSEEDAMVNFEVALRADGVMSVFDLDVLPTVDTVREYRVPRGLAIEAARRLQARGVTVHDIGRFTISASASEGRFEEVFNTSLEPVELPSDVPMPSDYTARAPRRRVEVPTTEGLDELVDRVYVQHDPILFAGERELPPFALSKEKFRLRVPGDIAQLMQATAVHRRGITGRGVRVAMVDSGFYRHPYFAAQGYDYLAVPAPDVVEPGNDTSGHGTGEAANLFATAPGINFVGVKMGNPTLAFRTAVELRPQVITCSWGFHVDLPNTTMPNWLKPLYLEVLDAVARGIVVCFSAGNGHHAFPANVEEVLAVGGTVADDGLSYAATEYTSGFESVWFPGRHVPDVTGLCGSPPAADYILLPVQAGASLEKSGGWGAFSGTSAASPMVAGVCALLLEADRTLTPQDVRRVLQYTARDITDGKCFQGHPAGPGPDLATGYGLVNAHGAVEAVL
jgi:hypothetical protein